MIIDLTSILRDPRRFEFTLHPDWWRGVDYGEQVVGLAGPLKVQVTISRAGKKFTASGVVSGSVRLQCGRCLDEFVQDLESDFEACLSLPPEEGDRELELAEEDMSVEFIQGGEFDLDEFVKEQVYLSLPLKILCHDDCRGLCPRCGANLNSGPCACVAESGHAEFSKLRKLRFRGD